MRSPNGKSELLNRLTSYDFNGDWRTLGENVAIRRVKPHILEIFFPDNGRKFQLVARIPREGQHARSKPKTGIAVGQAPPAPPKRTRRPRHVAEIQH